MSRSLAEVKAGFSPEMREQIDIRTEQIMAEIEGLKPMRIALEQTQGAVAKRLNVSQASVAKLEQRTDLLLSTLRQYVEALGGHMSIVVGFPNTSDVSITGLGDIPTSREVARLGVAPPAKRVRIERVDAPSAPTPRMAAARTVPRSTSAAVPRRKAMAHA